MNKLTKCILCEVGIGVVIISFLLGDLIVYAKSTKNNYEIKEYPITYEIEESTEITVEPREIIDPKEVAIQELEEKMNELEYIEDKEGWFISYKNLIEEHSDVIDPPETIYEEFSEEEIYLMQRVVETECHGGDFNSKCNVASVVRNRIFDKRFENTPTEVINSPNQFAYGRKKITEDTKLALEYVFLIGDTTDGCIGFHSNKKTETFNGWKYQFTDDIGHHLYK